MNIVADCISIVGGWKIVCVCVVAHSKWKQRGGGTSAECRRERGGYKDVSSPLFLWPLWRPALRVSKRTHTVHKCGDKHCCLSHIAVSCVLLEMRWHSSNISPSFVINLISTLISVFVASHPWARNENLLFHFPFLHTCTGNTNRKAYVFCL